MLRILVVSDLHAFTPGGKDRRDPSFLLVSEQPTVRINPLREIPAVLSKADLGVDWILCPGDIADQADPDAQKFAWTELVQLQTSTKAKLLLGTAGNHDLDSRLNYSDFDPKGYLQTLDPPFPGLAKYSDQYWARNFHIYEQGNTRLVNLNSAAFHGVHSGEPQKVAEYRHGRVSDRTIEQLVSAVSSKSFEHNILLTHHHPYKLEEVFDNDYSEMKLGGKLVNALLEATSSNWLVIHGHLHYPYLTYGPGDAFQAVMFSAGSVSAKISSPLADEAPNQFYHITLETDQTKTNGWGPCGFVRAWSWSRRRKWKPTPQDQNIPDGIGFGCRDNAKSIAIDIVDFIDRRTGNATFGQLFDEKPHLRFVMQRTFQQVVKLLESKGIKCTLTSPFSDSQLRRLSAP